MAQKEFKVGNFAKLFNYNVFFGDYLQYISWAVKFSKTVDTLFQGDLSKKKKFVTCVHMYEQTKGRTGRRDG